VRQGDDEEAREDGGGEEGRGHARARVEVGGWHFFGLVLSGLVWCGVLGLGWMD
jgi:hypothetical protein